MQTFHINPSSSSFHTHAVTADEQSSDAQTASFPTLAVMNTAAVRSPFEQLAVELDREYQSTTTIEWSALDQSVNMVIRREIGMSEARFVQRDMDEVIVYLSSQTGCQQACRFCHLTQSGQTQLTNESLSQYRQQAQLVLEYYGLLLRAGYPRASLVNFNFMSRGELLANPEVLNHGDELIDMLGDIARVHGLYPRFKCSTIMPQQMDDLELTDVFSRTLPDIYYSLYSVDPQWRRRWMPRAGDPHLALTKLARWQQYTRKIPVIHWALIQGGAGDIKDNGSEESVSAIIDAVVASGLRPDVNIVRYNPANDTLGAEPPAEVLDRVAAQLADGLPGSRVQIVGRVGHDVKASCGMFVTGPDAKRPGGLQQLPVLDSSASRFVR